MSAEAKAEDIREIIAEYHPDYETVFVEDGGATVVGHAEWVHLNHLIHAIHYLEELIERHDTVDVSVAITCDFIGHE